MGVSEVVGQRLFGNTDLTPSPLPLSKGQTN